MILADSLLKGTMEFISEIGLFSLKALVLTVAFGSILVLIAGLIARSRHHQPLLNIENLNEHYEQLELDLSAATGDGKLLKILKKTKKKSKKAKAKDEHSQRRIFVLKFDGDIRATHVENLRQEITAVLTVAKPGQDEVVVCVDSPGGMVHTYGLAATQLTRIRQAGLRLTVCVDKVAASGGYMMACTADHIVCAPFAIVGSIGVLAQVPNFNRLLKKHDIDYEEITAGEYKRTLSILGEITDKGRAKFTEQIQDTHDLFKRFIGEYRPALDLSKVATGEYWYGNQALGLGLVDQISTSDEFLFQRRSDSKMFKVEMQTQKKLSERLAENLMAFMTRISDRWLEKAQSRQVGAS